MRTRPPLHWQPMAYIVGMINKRPPFYPGAITTLYRIQTNKADLRRMRSAQFWHTASFRKLQSRIRDTLQIFTIFCWIKHLLNLELTVRRLDQGINFALKYRKDTASHLRTRHNVKSCNKGCRYLASPRKL